MRDIHDLGLTFKQSLEVNELDPLLVAAWLEHVDHSEVQNPAALFLVGVRSGVFPATLFDSKRERAVHLAEAWIEHAGLLCDRESEVLLELFDGPSSPLRGWGSEGRRCLRRRTAPGC